MLFSIGITRGQQRLKMVSTCNYQVMIFLCTLLFASIHFSESNDESLKNVFNVSPNLKLLSNVDVWLDNEVTSLSEILGKNVDEWEIRGDNAIQISQITFIALACNYSKIITHMVQSSEYIVRKCTMLKHPYLNYYRDAVLDILSSTLYYSKSLQVVTKKTFFLAVLATEIFLNKIIKFEPMSNWTVANAASYIKYSLESFTTEFCIPFTFKSSDFPNVREWPPSGDNCQDVNDKFIKGTIKTLLKEIELHMPDLESNEKEYNRHLFSFDNLMMSELMETELIQGTESSRIKNLDVDFQDKHINLNTVMEHVHSGYNSENIVKYQNLMIECMGSITLYLISKIIKANTVSEETSNDARINESIDNALSTLESLRSKGLLCWALKNIKFRKIINNNQRDGLEVVDTYFILSSFTEKSVDKLFQSEPIINNSDEFIEILNTFMKSIKKFRPLYLVITEIFNESYDISFEFGFQFFEPNALFDSSINSLSSWNIQIYSFAMFMIMHLKLSDALVTECNQLAMDINTNLDSTNVIECFSKIENYSIKSIKPIFKLFYGDLIKLFLTNDDNIFGPYYKLFEAMYSLLLYLNNSELYNVFDSKNSSTSSLHHISIKAKNLMRFHRVIATPLLYYLSLNYTIDDIDDLKVNLDVSHLENDNDRLLTIDHIVEKIKLNLNGYNYNYNNCGGISLDNDDDSEEEVGFDDSNDDDVKGNDDNDCDDDDVNDCDDDDVNECDNDDVCDIDNELNSEHKFEGDSDQHKYLHSSLARFADYEYLELGRFLFEDIIINANIHGYYCSFINEVRVVWVDGRYLAVRDIFEIVRNKMHPQHVYSFIVVMERIIVFTVSEKLKHIVKSIQKQKTVLISKQHVKYIKKSLDCIWLVNHSLVDGYITTLQHYLTKISRRENDTESCNLLISIIEKQQDELGVQLSSVASSETEMDTIQSVNESVRNFKRFAMQFIRIKKQFFPIMMIEWKLVANNTFV